MNLIYELFVEFFKQNPLLVITNLCFLFLVPLQDIILPHLYGKVMDSVNNSKLLLKWFIVVIILMTIIQVSFLLSDFHDAHILPKFQSFIREKMVQNILDTYEQSHQELETGTLISKIIKVPMTLTTWFERVKNYVIPYLLVFTLATFYFLWKDVPLGIGLALVVILFILLVFNSPQKCEKPSTERDIHFNNMHENIDDIFRNLYSVYGSNQKDKELIEMQKESDIFFDLHKNTVKCCLKVQVWLTPLLVSYLMFFMYRCYTRLNNKKLSASDFTPMFIILLYLSNSMYILNDKVRDTIFEWGVITSSEDVFEKINPKNKNKELKIYPDNGIGLTNVSFSYPQTNTKILDNITIHINKGEKVAIIGDIGSGKSTIIKLLMRFYTPVEGVVYIDGKSYNNMNIEDIRQKIGYVPQQPVLFNRSLLDNLLYGNTKHTREDVERLLFYLKLDDEFSSLENGLDTILGKNGSKISGGQRQIVWCLRVLMSNPEYVILDEPTASVDDKTKKILYNMIDLMTKNKTVIMVTHDEFLMKKATRKINIKKN